MVAEGVGGGWGPNAERVFHDLAKKTAAVSGEHPGKVQEEIFQSFSTILHIEGARSVLRRLPGSSTSPQELTRTRAATLASLDASHSLAEGDM
eukprot:7002829-Karenia_brevis.AAC.1